MKFREYIFKKTDIAKVISDQLNEVAFSESKLEKVVTIYAKILSKQFQGNFKNLGLESFKRKLGEGKGYRFINDRGVMLRFNWDAKLAKEAQYDLTSIDYWSPKNKDFQKPSRTVTFGPELNVVNVLDKIADALKSGSINEASRKEKIDWLDSKGLPQYLVNQPDKMMDRAEKEGLGDELRVFLGQSETNSFEENLQSAEKVFSKTVYANPDTIFDDITDLLTLVANKSWRTLVVCGKQNLQIAA